MPEYSVINTHTKPEMFLPFQASQAEIDDPDTETIPAKKGRWLPHKDVSTIEGYTGKHLACMKQFVVDGVDKRGRLDIGLYADTGYLKVYFLSSEFYNYSTNTWTNPKTNAVHICDISAVAKATIGGVDRSGSVNFGALDNFHKNAAGTVTSAMVQKTWHGVVSCFGLRCAWTRGDTGIIWYLDVPGNLAGLDISYTVFAESYFQQPVREADEEEASLRDIFFIDYPGIAKTEDTSGAERIVTYSMDPVKVTCDAADSRTWVQRYTQGAGCKIG